MHLPTSAPSRIVSALCVSCRHDHTAGHSATAGLLLGSRHARPFRRSSVTYAHNSEADFAASELARMFVADPALCYDGATIPSGGISATATSESTASPWPHADGLVTLVEPRNTRRGVAVEYKRPNEGVHGLLTGMGQVVSYLHKGYNGAVLVVPRLYTSHVYPGRYVKDVLDLFQGSSAVGVFHYDSPDNTSATPFAGRLHCVRPLRVQTTASQIAPASVATRTQWAHIREGSTTRDAYFRFLQTAKLLSAGQQVPPPLIPQPLADAIQRVAAGQDSVKYLANTADNRLLTRVWEQFWFDWILTPAVLTPWIFDGTIYRTPGAYTGIQRDDERGFSQIFEGRADGLKENIVDLLNLGVISEDQGWEYFARGFSRVGHQRKQGIRDRAHSYREDLDSSTLQLEWIDSDGHPTDRGHKFMSICERFGGPNSSAAREYFGATLIQTGRYSSFLHYVARLSERIFSQDPLAYTREESNGTPMFTEDSYTEYLGDLQDAMVNELKVMRIASTRNRPRVRTMFQAELTIMRNYGFVSSRRHRLGVGIPIDWERVLDAVTVDL